MDKYDNNVLRQARVTVTPPDDLTMCCELCGDVHDHLSIIRDMSVCPECSVLVYVYIPEFDVE